MGRKSVFSVDEDMQKRFNSKVADQGETITNVLSRLILSHLGLKSEGLEAWR